MIEPPARRGWDLGKLIAEHGVPGAQVAVLAGGEIQAEAAGVLNLRTGVETTPDAIFKVGSITKIWVATLVQQLVDEGALDLDRPVRDYLPGFRPSHPAAPTTRQLLTHTSGVDANHFFDTGHDAGSIGRFTDAIAATELFLPPGAMLSYSNSGYVVLGRLVEVLRGKPFHDVLRERLVAPLGLATVSTDADEAILHRAAVGHVEGRGQLVPTKVWAAGYGTAPSGSHLAMSAGELMAFVRMHLADPALAALREPQVDSVPDFGGGVTGWGLGWMRHRDGVVGHTGVSKGQLAFLRVAPAAEVAVAVLTNSTGADALAYEIIDAVLGDLAGVRTTPLPVPPANPAPLDAHRMCGTYRTTLYDITLAEEGELVYRPRTPRAESILGKAEDRVPVVRLGGDSVITAAPRGGRHQVLSVVGSDGSGRARFLHNGAAAYRVA
ncbi:serine hydrolase domain-containing protein [Actinokineospora sp. NPDC004072]